ncbi:magnesium protoporphyrin IX methyltransferase [Thalassococcus sp. S3]|uniref:magnesium protoporphyrin IX methyltransferase n=1 Tax=Thalassococcus sp. S3 TaxID=2017482 RepID=UPI0010241A2B|nr:magnesium protoporphyrin IX methyltransferase [Thalassococcus sp. S3]QBF34224.1 magnesium protoporphyrin IX methyltransferase [Thalassococcus sp. S3]
MTAYDQTLARVETYFDRTATQTWARLTSDAPVSKVRETVRAGRDRMRDLILSRLPSDLSGQRVLDAGCGAGQMSVELARRGAEVVACDISPSLVDIAKLRTPPELLRRITYVAGDMLDATHGRFDHVVAMDSLIYYTGSDIGAALKRLEPRTQGNIVFTVAPRTPLLMTMWYAGKLFPRSDRSPVMIPHDHGRLARDVKAQGVGRLLRPVDQITSGFYISQAMELRG